MKNVIKKLCGAPIIGEVVALIIGLILPVLPFILIAKSTGISDEIMMILGGIAIAGWNFFLKKTNTVNIVTPVLPIPVWIIGIVVSLVSLGYVVTGNQF